MSSESVDLTDLSDNRFRKSSELMDLGENPKSTKSIDFDDFARKNSGIPPTPKNMGHAHPPATLGAVPDTTQPEPPVLIPQHGSTGGRKPYNVRLRKALVAEVMDRPEYEGQSLAQVIELALERLLP
jgi:hypothetical protein